MVLDDEEEIIDIKLLEKFEFIFFVMKVVFFIMKSDLFFEMFFKFI